MMLPISICRNDGQNYDIMTQDVINNDDLIQLEVFDNLTHTHTQGSANCEETWEEFSSGLTMFLCPHLAINTVLRVDSHTLSSS